MKRLISTAIALALLGSTAALAQYDGRNDQNPMSASHNNNRGDHRQDYKKSHNDRPHWSRGDRVPDQFRQDQYAVGNWQQHNLRNPPRGYHWVRNDNNQFLLAAITTGIILDIASQNQNRNDYRWSRGERLSTAYRGNRYVVSDWRNRKLHRPSRGQHWVHVNDQYVLVATRSGLIAEVAFRNR